MDDASRPPSASDTPNSNTLVGLNPTGVDDDTPMSNTTPVRETKRRAPIDLSDSDNDSDDLSAGGLAGVDNLNISARLKRLMRDTTLTGKLGQDDDDDDSDDDDPLKDNVLFRTPAAVKTPAVQSLLRSEPSHPPTRAEEESNDSSDDEAEAAMPKRRAQRRPAGARPRGAIDFFAGDSESSSSSSGESEQEKQQQRRPKKKSTTTTTTTGRASDGDGKAKQQRPPKRAMSKRAELLMHQENQRLARTNAAKLQPRTDKLSLDHVMERFKQQRLPRPAAEAPSRQRESTVEIHDKVKALNDDSDSDLEIVHPKAVRQLDVASPDRPRMPFQKFQSPSPLQGRHRSSSTKQRHRLPMTHRDLNKKLQDMIAQDMLERRRHLEHRARATGTFKTAEEIVRHQLALEKQAQQIGMQVNQHFIKEADRKKQPATADDEVPDEEDAYAEPLLLSGDDEDEDMVTDQDENDATSAEDDSDNDNDNDRDTTTTAAAAALSPVRKRKRNNALFSDEEDSDDGAASDHGNAAVAADEDNTAKQRDESRSISDPFQAAGSAPPTKQQRKEKNEFLDAEAQESEDEFFGAGGPEGDDDDDDAHLDQFEKDGMVVDKTDEHVDEAALRAALNSQLAESDKHMVERLLKDIMSGDLRRRRAAREAGLMLDDYDIYDDPEDNDLIALRRAANERRKRLMAENGGDPLDALARDPKTAAFAKALQALPDNEQGLDLSDHEEEQVLMQEPDDDGEDDDDDDLDPRSNLSLVIHEDEEDEDDDDEQDTHRMMLDDIDADEGIAVVEQRQRTVVSADKALHDQQRLRLKRLLSESGGNLGASGDNSARVGLTAKSQPTERKVARYMELPTAAPDESPVQKREPRLLSLLKARKS